VAVVRKDVSKEFIAPIIRVKRISQLGTKLAVTGNFRSKRRFLYETNSVTLQSTAFFIVIVVIT
jgi:hypothetical protein